jgi:hypothetical protein
MRDVNKALSRESLGESTKGQTLGTARAWIVAATVIGTTIEWYDFFIYGTAAALVFNKIFFPSFDAAAGTIAAFATFARHRVRPLRRPLRTQVYAYGQSAPHGNSDDAHRLPRIKQSVSGQLQSS